MARSTITEREPLRILIHPLFYQLPNHPHEARMRAHGTGADEIEAESVCILLRFFIKVVQDFNVVGDEADGDGDDIGSAVVPPCPLCGNLLERFTDVRAQPRLRRRPAATLIRGSPSGMAQPFGY